MKTADLARLAREFADQIQDLLNRTITNGIPITAVLYPGGRQGWVGFQINKQAPHATKPIPVTISQADPKCFLVILHRLELDPERVHIATTSSRVELHLTDDLQNPIIRYDYNREPVLAKNELAYPAAHVHIHGTESPVNPLADAMGVERRLPDFHWPTGGRRFRPTLEDLIESMIIEELAIPHDGWQEAVKEHRQRWFDLQLSAAVRRNPEVARRALAEAGESE
ncbi:MAG: hypothetical protein OXG34_16030 [bacterium]|nr:hypothetical protein [bacterium]MCY4133297.1 hypothetical protein [bacterium]